MGPLLDMFFVFWGAKKLKMATSKQTITGTLSVDNIIHVNQHSIKKARVPWMGAPKLDLEGTYWETDLVSSNLFCLWPP